LAITNMGRRIAEEELGVQSEGFIENLLWGFI
jgi:hypothetical protein